jgi:hypothetical protein
MEEDRRAISLSLLPEPLYSHWIGWDVSTNSDFTVVTYRFHDGSVLHRRLSYSIFMDNPSLDKRDGKIKKGGTMTNETIRQMVRKEVSAEARHLKDYIRCEFEKLTPSKKERARAWNIRKALIATECMEGQSAPNAGQPWDDKDEVFLKKEMSYFIERMAKYLARTRRGIIWKMVSLIHDIDDADVLWEKDPCTETKKVHPSDAALQEHTMGTLRNVIYDVVCELRKDQFLSPFNKEQLIDKIICEVDHLLEAKASPLASYYKEYELHMDIYNILTCPCAQDTDELADRIIKYIKSLRR